MPKVGSGGRQCGQSVSIPCVLGGIRSRVGASDGVVFRIHFNVGEASLDAAGPNEPGSDAEKLEKLEAAKKSFENAETDFKEAKDWFEKAKDKFREAIGYLELWPGPGGGGGGPII